MAYISKEEYGRRLRQARMSQNLTQAQLAEKANVTEQAISKYESKGINSIETIQQLSEILGVDLLKDVFEVNEPIGEIGKEILIQLVINDGMISVSSVVNYHLRGLSEQQVTGEIVRLHQTGMLVREQYNNWDDESEDKLFLTVKGFVTIKNMDLNHFQSEQILKHVETVKTYEMLVGTCGSYQEFIDSSTVEKKIRALESDYLYGGYRINYIKYLKRNFETAIDYDGQRDEFPDAICPGISCYHDIIYNMICDITKEKLDAAMDIVAGMASDYETSLKTFLYVFGKLDRTKYDVSVILNEEFYGEGIKPKEDPFNNRYVGQRIRDLAMQMKKLYDGKNLPAYTRIAMNLFDKLDLTDASEDMLEDINSAKEAIDIYGFYYQLNWTPKEKFEEKAALHPQKNPVLWFTDDEIREYIEKNIPSVGYVPDIDEALREINELQPLTLDYFMFPLEWEQNGVADLVREKYGIEKK